MHCLHFERPRKIHTNWAQGVHWEGNFTPSDRVPFLVASGGAIPFTVAVLMIMANTFQAMTGRDVVGKR